MSRKTMGLAIVYCVLASASAFASPDGPNEPGLGCGEFQRYIVRPGVLGWKALWEIRLRTKDETVFRIPKGTVLQTGIPFEGQDIGGILDEMCNR